MNITGQTNSAVTTIPVKQNYNRVVSMAVDWNTGNVFMVQNARRSSKSPLLADLSWEIDMIGVGFSLFTCLKI